MSIEAALRHSRGDAGKVRCARDSVGEGNAVEQHGRCEGAQEEVLDGSLVRSRLYAA